MIMKMKTVMLGLLLVSGIAVSAQKTEEMKTLWDVKLSHDFDVTGVD